MKPYTIENIIANEIIDRMNSHEFYDISDWHFEFDYTDDIVVEVSGSINIEGYEENDYCNGTGDYIVTSVEVDITKVEFFDEEGLMPMRIDLAKIERLVEMDIR